LRRQARFGAARMIDTPFEHDNVDALGGQLSGEQAGAQPTTTTVRRANRFATINPRSRSESREIAD
jgi:hypothetical protein